MKTNHKRKFKDNKDPRMVYNNGYIVFAQVVTLPLSGRSVAAGTTCGDHTNGKRGIAKDRRGAKKFIRSRSRFHENAAVKRMVKQAVDIDSDEFVDSST